METSEKLQIDVCASTPRQRRGSAEWRAEGGASALGMK